MLIITRRPEETVMIGDDIKITLITIKGNQARFAIEAPSNIEIHREEIYQRIYANLNKIDQAV